MKNLGKQGSKPDLGAAKGLLKSPSANKLLGGGIPTPKTNVGNAKLRAGSGSGSAPKDSDLLTSMASRLT